MSHLPTTATAATALLLAELQDRGGLPGTAPDAWPGSWVAAAVAAEPALAAPLRRCALERLAEAAPDSAEPQALLPLLSGPLVDGSVADALLRLAEQARQRGDFGRSGALLRAAHSAWPWRSPGPPSADHPAVRLLEAAEVADAAKAVDAGVLAALAPAELDALGALLCGTAPKMRGTLAAWSRLDAAQRSALAPHLRGATFGPLGKDKALLRAIRAALA